MNYRLADISDIDDICTLVDGAIKKMESQEIFQWDEFYPTKDDFQRDIEKESLFLALDEDEIAAFYVISDESDEAYNFADWKCDADTSYILHRFCVSPFFQNKGIGREVLLHIENQIRNMGFESVRLDVFTKNPFAQRLYRNNGYEVTGHADWRKGRFDLMEKKLIPCEERE